MSWLFSVFSKKETARNAKSYNDEPGEGLAPRHFTNSQSRFPTHIHHTAFLVIPWPDLLFLTLPLSSSLWLDVPLCISINIRKEFFYFFSIARCLLTDSQLFVSLWALQPCIELRLSLVFMARQCIGRQARGIFTAPREESEYQLDCSRGLQQRVAYGIVGCLC